MPHKQRFRFGKVINTNITAISLQETVEAIEGWIHDRENKYVCICNTHSLVSASNDSTFQKALSQAAICTPDGMPVVWALRMYGYRDQERVDGPSLMQQLCSRAANHAYRIFLYGGTEQTLQQLTKKLSSDYEGIELAGHYSPPFRELTLEEKDAIIERINTAKADIVFVSLGCPKQEAWMHEHSHKVNGVMIGVGAAFEFLIGNVKRPPMIFQQMGLEWLFRLVAEPTRLWKRYAYNNPLYLIRFIKTFRQNKQYTKRHNETTNSQLSSM